jgi:hypothetical protein
LGQLAQVVRIVHLAPLAGPRAGALPACTRGGDQARDLVVAVALAPLGGDVPTPW